MKGSGGKGVCVVWCVCRCGGVCVPVCVGCACVCSVCVCSVCVQSRFTAEGEDGLATAAQE